MRDPNPAILIAASYQALNRSIRGPAETQLCDCTVTILFAAFYIEANLNYVIKWLGRTEEMRTFLGARYPGLQDKLAWYHNEYVVRLKAGNKKALHSPASRRRLRRRFPGFAKIYRFRNDLSHGVVNSSARSLTETQLLREQAKDIEASLFAIAKKHGHEIPKPIGYYEAIGMPRSTGR